MDDVSQVPGPIRQAQLIREIASAVAERLPSGWKRVRFIARVTCEVSTCSTLVTQRVDEEAVRSSRRAWDLAKELRSVMYQPGAGTWFTFTLDITSDGQANSSFDYDGEPDIPWADPTVYLTDQEKFPREVENQPEWYKGRLAEAERLLAERAAEQ